MEIWVGAEPGVGADPRLNAEECLLGGMRRWWWAKQAGVLLVMSCPDLPLSFFPSKVIFILHLKRQGLDVLE